MSKWTRIGRAVGAEAMAAGAEALRAKDEKKPAPEWVQPDTPVAVEREKVLKVARRTYRVQLAPWYVFFAAVIVGLAVQDEGLGVIVLAPVLAGAGYMMTQWRLHWRGVLRGTVGLDQLGGRRMRRIDNRAVRSAKAGAALGVWFTAAAVAGPLSSLVWTVGAAVWAVAAYHGWWRPAELSTPHTKVGDESHDDEPLVTVNAAPQAHGDAPRKPSAAPRGRGSRALPPRDLLKRSVVVPTGDGDDLTEEFSNLFDDQKVIAKVVNVTRGPTVARYDIEPGRGVKVAAIKRMAPDLARVAKCPELRILSPVPGTSVIGIEVPVANQRVVSLREVLDSPVAVRDNHPLLVGLGMNIEGDYVVARLSDLVHALIGGATGAGKSVCLNNIIGSILTRATPDDVRLLLIDPKKVELTLYDGIPHLITPVVTTPEGADYWLGWLEKEMDDRYELFKQAGVRNIEEYNQKTEGARLAYLVTVVDELADLMMVSKRRSEDEDVVNVEQRIVRLGQLARAAGITMLLATQRPSVDVVTGLIKANMPSRLALKTTSAADSRVILDAGGAEKLIGKGDALFHPNGEPRATRMQCAFVGIDDIKTLVDYWRGRGPTSAPPQGAPQPPPAPDAQPQNSEDADLLVEAVELVVSSQFGSTSMLQRKLRVGFAKAGQLMDEMQDCGVVGPAEGSKARDVLVKPEELEAVLAAIRPPRPAPAPAPSPQGVATARDTLLQVAVEHADDNGEVTKQTITAKTKEMNEKTRDKAITDLTVPGGPLIRLRPGVYRIRRFDDQPFPNGQE